MFKKRPTLKYESSLDWNIEPIVPAKTKIPEWYKKIPQWKDNVVFEVESGFRPTLKQCFPFTDSLTIGYMITLPYDLYVKNDNDSPYLTWPPGVLNPPKWRKNIAHKNVVPAGHYPTEYLWTYPVSYMVPNGYTVLLTHPLNRYDLPFTTLTGVIDGGIVMAENGHTPFYIKQNFEGIIEKGTPIAQIIPFFQEDWKSEKTKGLFELGNKTTLLSESVIQGWYKKNIWKRKKYD